MEGTILVADDDRTMRTVLSQALTRAGCKVHATSSLMTLMRWIEEGRGDLVISDIIMPDGNGLEALPRISQMRPGLPVIIISAQNTVITAVEAAEKKAYKYLPKPFDFPDLIKHVARALDTSQPAPKIKTEKHANTLPLVGKSKPMQSLYAFLARVMNADLSVLITGESGTGKSLIAKVIHDFSDRRTLPLVICNERDLEGIDGPSSVLERVRSGTIVFDEIGDMSDEAQSKLVRMIDRIEDVSPRIMATSQKDLTALMEEGKFRQDLYYRITGVVMRVPSLRQRLDDIALLAEHFLSQSELRTGYRRQLSEGAEQMVRNYSWPGNVRQLESTIKQLVLTSSEPTISFSEIEEILGTQPVMHEVQTQMDDAKQFSESIGRCLRRYFDLHGKNLPPRGLYKKVLREIERPMFEIVLEATNGNQAQCADVLGINRNTLRKKITDLGITATRRRKMM